MNGLPSIWPALSAFVVVLALIPLAIWILKKVQGGTPRSPRRVILEGGINLGPRERVVVVQAEGRRWLLGVTQQSITPIAELEPGPSDPEPAPGAETAKPAARTPFATLLDTFKRHD